MVFKHHFTVGGIEFYKEKKITYPRLPSQKADELSVLGTDGDPGTWYFQF